MFDVIHFAYVDYFFVQGFNQIKLFFNNSVIIFKPCASDASSFEFNRSLALFRSAVCVLLFPLRLAHRFLPDFRIFLFPVEVGAPHWGPYNKPSIEEILTCLIVSLM